MVSYNSTADKKPIYYINQLEIGPLDLNCQTNQNSKLLDQVLNFQVQYDDLQRHFTIVNYTINFVYSYKVWDRRLVLVVIVILASLTCLVSFIVYKFRVVKRTKEELK